MTKKNQQSITSLHDRSISPEKWEQLSAQIIELEKERKDGIWTTKEVHDEIRSLMKEAFTHQESIESQQVVSFGALLERIIAEQEAKHEKNPENKITAINVVTELDKTLMDLQGLTPFGKSPQAMIQESFGTAEAAYPHHPVDSLSKTDQAVFQERFVDFCETATLLLGNNAFKNHEGETRYETDAHSVSLSELEYSGKREGHDRILTLEAITKPNAAMIEKHGSNAIPGLFFITINLDRQDFSIENLLQEYGKKTTQEEQQSIAQAIFRSMTSLTLPSEKKESASEGTGAPLIPHLRVRNNKPYLAIGNTEVGKILFERLSSSTEISSREELKDFIKGLKQLEALLTSYQQTEKNTSENSYVNTLNFSELITALKRKSSYLGRNLSQTEKKSMQHAAKLIQVWMAYEAITSAQSDLAENERWEKIASQGSLSEILQELRPAA